MDSMHLMVTVWRVMLHALHAVGKPIAARHVPTPISLTLEQTARDVSVHAVTSRILGLMGSVDCVRRIARHARYRLIIAPRVTRRCTTFTKTHVLEIVLLECITILVGCVHCVSHRV